MPAAFSMHTAAILQFFFCVGTNSCELEAFDLSRVDALGWATFEFRAQSQPSEEPNCGPSMLICPSGFGLLAHSFTFFFSFALHSVSFPCGGLGGW